ncbi:RcnB family protein [Dyella sp. ASV21]|uniref:RcnB family protein n=1 Tax=Dyella sp. ASV21 TaxID=2795114 RepID=UPI0018EDAC02|nr:RcnB family protein [Dyella sp. ASV21]
MERSAMNTLTRVLATLALIAGSGATLADPWHDHDRGHDRDGHYERDRGQDRGDGYRDRDRHEYWQRRYYSDRSYYGRPHWQRGYRYDGPMYIVNDYRGYRLAPPPYGYRWVRSDNNYLLVSIGDNVILDMVIR